jgi:hypothetical protein
VFQAATFQKVIELLLDVDWQRLSLGFELSQQFRVMSFDKLIEQRLLWTMALVNLRLIRCGLPGLLHASFL